jgi:surface antigen
MLEYRTVGCCQPQSLIYARCRTGIKSCQLGDTSPVQWFACARKNGATTATPTAGSVIVLDANTGRNMPTGHPAYVEEVAKNQDGTWTLRISHTNYDRKCHLDLDATVLFDPKRMTASFESGPWGPWAKNLKVMGFILQ